MYFAIEAKKKIKKKEDICNIYVPFLFEKIHKEISKY
jgi:hypothetical protein